MHKMRGLLRWEFIHTEKPFYVKKTIFSLHNTIKEQKNGNHHKKICLFKTFDLKNASGRINKKMNTKQKNISKKDSKIWEESNGIGDIKQNFAKLIDTFRSEIIMKQVHL